MSKIAKIFTHLAMLGCLLAPTIPASAEFLFKPLFLVIDAPKGKATGSITISNPFEKPARLQLSMNEWDINSQNEFEILEYDKDQESILKHVRITPRQFTIKPNETKTVRIAARLPKDYEDGEYKLFLNMLEIGADRKSLDVGQADQAFGLVINKQFRAGTYIRKGDPASLKSKLDIAGIESTGTEGQVAKYNLKYTNTGKVHVRKDIGVRFYEAGTEKLAYEVPFAGVLIAFPTNGEVEDITVEKSIRIPETLDQNAKYDVELVLVDSIEDEASRAQNNPVIVTDRFQI